jgi:hypothetical protein
MADLSSRKKAAQQTISDILRNPGPNGITAACADALNAAGNELKICSGAKYTELATLATQGTNMRKIDAQRRLMQLGQEQFSQPRENVS